MNAPRQVRELPTEADTLAFGARLAGMELASELVFLHGGLGAGKTTLARGYLRALGHRGTVKSPTYTLLESYALSAAHVLHFDFYRIADGRELGYIGMEELLAEAAVKLVEWPERVRGFLPPADIEVWLETAGQGRRVELVDHRALAHSRATGDDAVAAVRPQAGAER